MFGLVLPNITSGLIADRIGIEKLIIFYRFVLDIVITPRQGIGMVKLPAPIIVP